MSQRTLIEDLEERRMLAFASYAQLVEQDAAVAAYPKINGTGTTVAVIDTGIDYKLPILGGAFGGGVTSKNKVIGGYDFYQNDGDPMDTDGHGTDVASVIAANPFTFNGVSYQGVAPGAKLVALRVGTEDDITDTNIDKALQWVIKNYKSYKISVINMSLGSGSYTDSETESPLSDDLATLKKLGIFVTAASGNSNDQQSGPISQDGIAFPAADPNVFAVGAVDSSDVITTWSQRGDELDLLAPGVNIVLPTLTKGSYTTEDGTSFSSPYVAGTAALLKQVDPTALAGDIGSTLMGSGVSNRDGDNETGNTTGLLFSRLDIKKAIAMASARTGVTKTLAVTKAFDTALDSEGVLHAAFYDSAKGRVIYATRATDGLWSRGQVVDASADVGAQVSIAVDNSGKTGIAYFDVTNTSLKYATQGGSGAWTTTTIDSDKHVGTFPSLGFSIDGTAYLAYYRRSSGDLRLATLDRDANTWSRLTVDGTDGSDVGQLASLYIGEAAVEGSFGFTVYHTTVAIAYADTTNGEVKYARLDEDDPTATWFISNVAAARSIGAIDLKLHTGPQDIGLQAQIAYVNSTASTVYYAYRNTDWFTEPVAGSGPNSLSVQLSFDDNNNPVIGYFQGTKRAVYLAQRSTSAKWSSTRIAAGSGTVNFAANVRTDDTYISYLNRARTAITTVFL